MKKRVSTIITDLDDTLFNWFEPWHRAFRAMLNQIVQDTGIPEVKLLPEIKAIHERHGTAEYSLLLLEIEALKEKYKGKELAKRLRVFAEAYQEARSAHLKLYPSVLESLETMKERGCLVVGYTESQSLYTQFRVKELGLDGILDYLYVPPNHDLPSEVSWKAAHLTPVSGISLTHTKLLHTPKGEHKPNPHILSSIIEEADAEKDETIYVGNSLDRDIAMAQAISVTDVYAEYGSKHEKEEYELLRQVTFWTAEQVEREKKTTKLSVKPSYTLKNSFSELLALFEFIPYTGGKSGIHSSLIPHYLELWKKTIDVQQHFNDLELRIRNFAITVLGAILTASAVTLDEGLAVEFGDALIPIAKILVCVALVVWLAFYFMDRLWYHRLLIGAVRHGERIENRIENDIPEIDLTRSIGKASPFLLFWKWKIHSSHKMDIFYLTVAIVLTVMLLIL